MLATASSPLLGSRLEITALRSDHRVVPGRGRDHARRRARARCSSPSRCATSRSAIEHEERLREAEAKYRTLVEQLPLATYINSVGLPVQTTYMSPQIERDARLPGRDWLEPDFFVSACIPDDRERVFAEVERTHTTGEDFRLEYRLIAADGRVVWVLDETIVVRDDRVPPDRAAGLPRRRHRPASTASAPPSPLAPRPRAG